jgi:hypothetical protein
MKKPWKWVIGVKVTSRQAIGFQKSGMVYGFDPELWLEWRSLCGFRIRKSRP